MNSRSLNLIFLGIKGTVSALNRSNGELIWQTHLKGSDFVNLVIDGENLYATTKGEIFCLDTITGQLRWHNKLPGLGWGLVTIATPCSTRTISAEQKRRYDQAAATAATAAS